MHLTCVFLMFLLHNKKHRKVVVILESWKQIFSQKKLTSTYQQAFQRKPGTSWHMLKQQDGENPSLEPDPFSPPRPRGVQRKFRLEMLLLSNDR